MNQILRREIPAKKKNARIAARHPRGLRWKQEEQRLRRIRGISKREAPFALRAANSC